MHHWIEGLRFLWEEETAPPAVASPRPGSGNHSEPTGIPGPLQKAARFALIGVVATSLISQIIEVRLIAPVDAAPSYVALCIQANCKDPKLTGAQRAECNHACQEAARNIH